MGWGGLSAPTTTPSKRSLHPEASIKMVLSGKKQSNANLITQDYKLCERLFLYLLLV
jgi:hypothetical protein